jgi:hypothetical protein
VSYAYAFEQAGPRRRPPVSTPPLIKGKPPTPVTFVASAAGIEGRFSYDPLSSDLSYTVRAAAKSSPAIQAVVLRRKDAEGTRVIRRVLGPEMRSAGGWIRLLGADLTAFRAGGLSLAVFGDRGADPIAEVAVTPR